MSDAAPISRDLEEHIRRGLRHAAPVPGPEVADRILSATALVSQRQPWYRRRVAPILAMAAVAVLAAAVGLGLGRLLIPPDVGTPGASESSSQTPSAIPSDSASATPAPSATEGPFPNGSRCENVELGYTVSFPADWHANEEVRPDDEALDPVPACQYFGEEPMEILPNAGIPPSAAISFSLEADPLPPGGTVLRSESVTVAGRPAEITEVEGDGDAPLFREGDRAYYYQIELASGDVLIVHTDSTRTGDYEAHRDVLDRMMQTLELTGD